MINENRIGLALNPWAVMVPAALIALLTIGTNTFTDAIARAAIGVDRRPEEAAAGRRPRPRAVTEDERATATATTVAPVTGRQRLQVNGLRCRSPPAVPTWSTRSRSRSPPAACSAWSASPARARPPLPSPCSDTPDGACSITGGEVRLDGMDMLSLQPGELTAACAERGSAYVPQDPAAALNPALRVGRSYEKRSPRTPASSKTSRHASNR